MRQLIAGAAVRGRLVGLALVLGISLLGAPGAYAAVNLIGSNVTGIFEIFNGNNPPNLFDPANGAVPPGPLNKTFGTTVTIGSPAIEFGYLSQFGPDMTQADFDATTLTISETLAGGVGIFYFPHHFTFIDAALNGLTLMKVSDSFIGNGLTASLTGSLLTIDWAGAPVPPGTVIQSAVFSFSDAGTNGGGGGSSAPLPRGASAGLIALAASSVALAAGGGRQRRVACRGQRRLAAYTSTFATGIS
jgi:hypothetical protein